MKSNELMIGDWVRVNRDGLCIKKDTIVQVRGIDGDDKIEEKGLFGATHCRPLDGEQFDGGIWLDYLDPIPLTPEILEKNGWKQTSKRDDERGTMEKWFLPNIAYAYCFSNNEIEFEIIGYGNNSHGRGKYRGVLSFVHELQHALNFCGVKKEVVL